MTKQDTHASVWDALADTPEHAANMRTRSELMQQIATVVKEKQWVISELAKICWLPKDRADKVAPYVQTNIEQI
jgi:predicted XRE-type DNA-binding protein